MGVSNGFRMLRRFETRLVYVRDGDNCCAFASDHKQGYKAKENKVRMKCFMWALVFQGYGSCNGSLSPANSMT